MTTTTIKEEGSMGTAVEMSLVRPVAEARRVDTGAWAPVDVPVKRSRPRPVTSEERQALGSTRWASPPPGVSWRAYALTLLAGDVGLILIAWGMGWIP